MAAAKNKSMLSNLIRIFELSRKENAVIFNTVKALLSTSAGKQATETTTQTATAGHSGRNWALGTRFDRHALGSLFGVLKSKSKLSRWARTGDFPILIVICSRRMPHLVPSQILKKIIFSSTDAALDGANEARRPLLILDLNVFGRLHSIPGLGDSVHLAYGPLIMLAFFSPIEAFKAYMSVRSELSEPTAQSTRRAPLQLLVALALAKFVTAYSRTERAILFTSNSVFSEIIRWEMLVKKETRSLVEVLHAVPTIEVERYQSRLRRVIGVRNFEKQFFVGSVPTNGLFGVFKRPLRSLGWLNTGMLAATSSLGGVEGVNSQVLQISSAGGAFVVSLNGANSHDISYVDSLSFHAEIRILSQIMALSAKMGRSITLVYSVHPTHLKTGASEEIRRVLRSACGQVRFCSHSLPTWLISNLCISLYSSSAWDANALGCPAFIAVRKRDGIYSSEALRAVHHPGDDESWSEALERTIVAMFMDKSTDSVDVQSRLNQLSLINLSSSQRSR